MKTNTIWRDGCGYIKDEWVYLGLMLVVVFSIWAGFTLVNTIWVGHDYQATMTVQAIELDPVFGEHTRIYYREVFGDSPKKLELYGYHNLSVGQTYTIKYRLQYAIGGVDLWGKVISIEEVRTK